MFAFFAIIMVVATTASRVKIYHEDPCPNADVETLVVEVPASESYYNDNGELMNVVDQAVLAQHVLDAIRPRLAEARRNNEFGIVAELNNIQSEMEELIWKHNQLSKVQAPSSLKATNTKKITKSTNKKMTSKKTSEPALLSPVANMFALGLMLLFIGLFTVFCCCLFCGKSSASKNRKIRARQTVTNHQ